MTEEDNARQGFPGLAGDTTFRKSSDADPRYNCIAWAAGDETRWWWPMRPGVPSAAGTYWPPGTPLEENLETFLAVFEDMGYERCADGSLEAGFEKIAIYADAAGSPTHAARQLPSGEWTSKLGPFIDIIHETPDRVAGDRYGDVAHYLRRRS